MTLRRLRFLAEGDEFQRLPLVRAVARVSAVAAALMGAVVLAGWAVDLPQLRSLLPGAVEMKANTAVGLLLASGTLLLLNGRPAPASRRLGLALALGVTALGLATLAEYAFGWELGIDELLFRDTGTAFNLIRGRMSPYSAGAFAGLGLALAALSWPRLRPLVWAGAMLGIAVGAVSLLGYLWGASELVTDQLAPPVAVHTALAFVLLGGSTLMTGSRAAAGPDSPIPALTSLEIRVLVGFVGGLAMLLLAGGVVYRNNAGSEEWALRQAHARQAGYLLRELYGVVSDAQSAQLAYLLTGTPRSRDAYERLASLARDHLKALRGRDLLEDPTQARELGELDRLAGLALDDLSRTLRLHDRGDTGGARDSVRSGRGAQALGAMRAAIERIDAAQGARQIDRQAAFMRSRRVTLLVLLFVLAAAAAAVAVLLRGVRREVAARGLAEQALQRHAKEVAATNRFLDSVIENIPSVITVREALELRLVRINRAGEALLGHSRDELLGGPVYDLFPQEEAKFFASKDREALAQARPIEVPVERVHTRNHGLRMLHARKVPILGEDQRPTHLLTIAEDITEQEARKAEILRLNEALQLRAADADSANRAKSTFLATMSHEIRTPMNGLLGMIELLSVTRLDAQQQAMIDVVHESSKSLLRIIDDILDFSKIEAGKLDIRPQVISVHKIIADVHSIYGGNASSKGVVLRREVDPRISPAVRADPLRLRQILNNFVSNALKFTQQGSIEIRAEWIERVDGRDRVRFSVKDTGTGISEQDQRRLFEPFSQGGGEAEPPATGTGLGLVICRRLAHLMDGTVEMVSALGQGTTLFLTLWLPVADPQDLPKADVDRASARALLTAATGARRPAPGAAQAEAEGTLVLLVDDHPTNRALLLRQVHLLGYAAQCAENGAQALREWQSGRYALIITDCHMPEMDGYELARRVRRIESAEGGRRTPIIACTARALSGEVELCLAAGMDDCLVKPVELSRLMEKLDHWLPLPAAAAAVAGWPGPGLAGEGDAPVDLSVIAATWGGEAATAYAILADFRRSNDADADLLRLGLTLSDLTRVRGAAHRMLGAGRMVGAHAFAAVCERIDQACRAGDWAPIRAAMQAFEHEHGRVNAYIESLPTADRPS